MSNKDRNDKITIIGIVILLVTLSILGMIREHQWKKQCEEMSGEWVQVGVLPRGIPKMACVKDGVQISF